MLTSSGRIGFTAAELLRLLGNRLAAAAMRGESLPVVEAVYERLLVAQGKG